jgi:hypothetical protein
MNPSITYMDVYMLDPSTSTSYCSRVTCVEDTYDVSLDYLPREDLLMHVDYYDKYFAGVEEGIYRLVHPLRQKGGAVQISPISESVLTRMLTSPFAINIRLNRGDDDEVDVLQ